MNKNTVQHEYESLLPTRSQPEFRTIQRNRRGPMMRVKIGNSNIAKARRRIRNSSKSSAYNAQSRGKRLDRFLTSQEDGRDILTESAYASSSNTISSSSLFDPYAPVNLDELLHSEYESLSLSPRPESIFRVPRCLHKILPTNHNRHVYVFFGGLFLVLSLVILTCLTLPNALNQKLVFNTSIMDSSAKKSSGIFELDIDKVTSKMEEMDPKTGNVNKDLKLTNASSSALKGKMRGDLSLEMDYGEDDMVLYSPKIESGQTLHDDYVLSDTHKEGHGKFKVVVKATKQKRPISPLNKPEETAN